MNTSKQSTNERLRAIVEASGLTQAEALAAFNKPLGAAGYSLDLWEGFLCDPASKRFRPLRSDLLAHAKKGVRESFEQALT